MRVLVLQHIDVEHPGSFRGFMDADGIIWDAVELDQGDEIPESLDRYDAMMVMGGPMDVWDEDKLPWLAAEKKAIREWAVERGAPYLGICLGHQLLAEAVGGTVGLMKTPEVGICDVRLTAEGRRDSLFGAIDDRFPCLQWHSAEVRNMPATTTVSAVNETGCIEAFRYGAHAFGLQFHVEITPDTVAEWAAVPAYRASLDAIMGTDGLARLARDTDARLASIQLLARSIYTNFFDAVEASAHHAPAAASEIAVASEEAGGDGTVGTRTAAMRARP